MVGIKRRFVRGIASAALLLVPLCGAYAEGERVNSKESIKACKTQLVFEQSGGVVYTFKRKTATKVDASMYQHWLNAVQTEGERRESIKILCETSRAGVVQSLTVQPGRWTF